MTATGTTGRPANPAAPPGARTAPAARSVRIVGIDVARACAIIGMFAVHVGPTSDTTVPGRLYALAHGRASLLFVLVAGVGVSLLARSTTGRHATGTRRTLLWRAAILLPAGLLLQLLDHGVNVILQGYALLFVLAALLVTASSRWLLALAATIAAVGPVVFLVGRMGDPARFTRDEVAWGDSTSQVVDGLVLSGPYPLVTWAAPLLLGMWLGRQDLTSPHLQRRLVVLGMAVAGGALAVSTLGQALLGSGGRGPGWRDLLATVPHSQMPLWLLGGTGAAAGILGIALWAGARATTVVRPLIAIGRISFTAYVAHLLVLHAWSDAVRTDDVLTAAITVVVGAGLLALLATAWLAITPRGPLEALLRPPRVLRPRTTPSVHG